LLSAPPGNVEVVEPTQAYRLHPSVAVRPEPFGALVYHYGNRKLVFLKSPRILAVVNSLSAHPSVVAALDAHDVPAASRAKYLVALTSLETSNMIVVRESSESSESSASEVSHGAR
jgi:putative mycofactocin binding protein MftB